jgi:acylphosphatase
MSASRTVLVRIEGRVQSVGYRAWIETMALALGLSGWVLNRHDGAVEVVFQGPSKRVADMLHRCKSGPPAARVVRVDVLGQGVDVFNGFAVRPSA